MKEETTLYLPQQISDNRIQKSRTEATKPLYCDYNAFVLKLQKPCTDATKALYG